MTDPITRLFRLFIECEQIVPVALPRLPDMRSIGSQTAFQINSVRLERQHLLWFEKFRCFPNNMTIVHDEICLVILLHDLAALGQIVQTRLAPSAIADQEAIQHAVQAATADMDDNAGFRARKSARQQDLRDEVGANLRDLFAQQTQWTKACRRDLRMLHRLQR